MKDDIELKRLTELALADLEESQRITGLYVKALVIKAVEKTVKRMREDKKC